MYRSVTLEGDCTTWNGIPITTAPRTLLDAARMVSPASLARALRDAVRLKRTSLAEVGDILGKHRGRRGARKLALAVSRYSGLPLERARSGAEIRAMQLLRDSGRPLPQLNFKIADEEADLSWPALRLIIEIDGGPYHLDTGEDARKEAVWRGAGWEVLRIPSDDVYENPGHLLALAPK